MQHGVVKCLPEFFRFTDNKNSEICKSELDHFGLIVRCVILGSSRRVQCPLGRPWVVVRPFVYVSAMHVWLDQIILAIFRINQMLKKL